MDVNMVLAARLLPKDLLPKKPAQFPALEPQQLQITKCTFSRIRNYKNEKSSQFWRQHCMWTVDNKSSIWEENNCFQELP